MLSFSWTSRVPRDGSELEKHCISNTVVSIVWSRALNERRSAEPSPPSGWVRGKLGVKLPWLPQRELSGSPSAGEQTLIERG